MSNQSSGTGHRTDPAGSRSLVAWLKTSTIGSVLILSIVVLAVLLALWAVAAARNNTGTELADEGGGAGTASAVEVPDSGSPAPKIGEAAPTFTAVDTQGQEIDLESLRGKPVWLVFNATWCSNCRAELPDIEAVHEEYGDRVEIVGIYLSDSEQVLEPYAQRLRLTFPQIADPSSDLGALYRVMGVPTHYFVDTEGTVVSIDVGTLSPKTMQERLQELLGV